MTKNKSEKNSRNSQNKTMITTEEKPVDNSQTKMDGTLKQLNELLNEIADGMLDFQKQIATQGNLLSAIEARMVALENQQLSGAQATAREINKMRTELISEQGSAISVSIFNSLVPVLDSLRSMEKSLRDTDAETPVYNQVNGVLQILKTMLRSLKIVDFCVEPGEIFDPNRMQAVERLPGEPDHVLKMLRPGYVINDQVLRPADVQIGAKKFPVTPQ